MKKSEAAELERARAILANTRSGPRLKYGVRLTQSQRSQIRKLRDNNVSEETIIALVQDGSIK